MSDTSGRKTSCRPAAAIADTPHVYAAPAGLSPNRWALAGNWQVAGEAAEAVKPGARIVFRFHARDLHLVLGPAQEGRTIRFRVTLDGHAPGEDHGVDVAPDGSGAVTTQRLYRFCCARGHGRKVSTPSRSSSWMRVSTTPTTRLLLDEGHVHD